MRLQSAADCSELPNHAHSGRGGGGGKGHVQGGVSLAAHAPPRNRKNGLALCGVCVCAKIARSLDHSLSLSLSRMKSVVVHVARAHGARRRRRTCKRFALRQTQLSLSLKCCSQIWGDLCGAIILKPSRGRAGVAKQKKQAKQNKPRQRKTKGRC